MADIEEIIKKQRQDNLENLRSKMDRKAEIQVLERRKQMERMESELEKQLENERNTVLVTIDKHQKEEMLASEISRLKQEETRAKKIREHLRESSEEIKLLEKKLRAAYVNKQLITQIAEKEAAVAQEKLEKLKIQEIIETENMCMEEKSHLNGNSVYAKKFKYREELLNQIKEGNQNEHDRQRDLILEKALLEQTQMKILEEDKIEKMARLQKLYNERKEIEEFLRQQEMRKHSEKLANEAEEARIKAYADKKEMQEQRRVTTFKEKEGLKIKIVDYITTMNSYKLQSRKEREEILAELAEEEARLRDVKKDKETADAAKKVKDDFLNFYKKYAEEKEIAWRTDFKEQKHYRNELIENQAFQEKVETSSAGNIEKKKKELRESLLSQMKDKHRRQIEEWQRDLALERLREVEQQEKNRILEDERFRILRSHDQKLARHNPNSVLDDKYLNNSRSGVLESSCEGNAMT